MSRRAALFEGLSVRSNAGQTLPDATTESIKMIVAQNGWFQICQMTDIYHLSKKFNTFAPI